MGSYSPHPWLNDSLVKTIMSKVAEPLIRGVREEYDILYRGILYLGLMLVENGTGVIPYVLEINIRLGDPEAQVILPRLKTDLVDISEAIATGRLDTDEARVGRRLPAVSDCHERSYQGEKRLVQGLSGPLQNRSAYRGFGSDRQENASFFTPVRKRTLPASLVTTGGRVLCIVSSGSTLEEARETALSEMEKVRFEGIYYRKDIGLE